MKLDFLLPKFPDLTNEKQVNLNLTAGLSAQPKLLKYLVEGGTA